MSGWEVVERRGSAQALHDLDPEPGTGRAVWWCRPAAPALVLGSTQRSEVADRAALEARGVELARRRSGGGAVLLDDDAAVWLDVLVPRGDPLWSDDVVVAAHWLGDAWVAALAELGLAGAAHRGGLVRRPWSELVCFAGLGPGEVTVGGRKVVGVSQRRTRAGARFQVVVLRRWRPERLVGLLALDPAERQAAAAALRDVAAGVDAAPDRLLAALVAALP